MKRRKIVGIILIALTFIYFLACLLALYQNQRVKMEQGIEEALKAYANANTEILDIKELSKDFNLMLEDKIDVKEGKEQISKFEGSFARIEKSITDVNNEINTCSHYFISQLRHKIDSRGEMYGCKGANQGTDGGTQLE